MVFLGLVAALAWLIWRFAFLPHTYYAVLSVKEYTRHAVPPVPYFENDARYFSGTIQCRTLNTAQTFEGMSDLATSLDEVVSRQRDALVLYVSAHGASLSSGAGREGYLLCADFANVSDGRRAGDVEGCLKIADFLSQVRNCAAGVKLVILDAGHLPTDPRLGVLVNEFPTLLARAVKETGDPNLWVLSANSLHESSHVAHAQHQSVFNYFVVRALAGDADVSPPDRLVDLAELTNFVHEGVSQWMRGQYNNLETQTPQLLWGGGEITPAVIDRQMRQVALKPNKVAAATEKQKPAPKAAESTKTAQRPRAPSVQLAGAPVSINGALVAAFQAAAEPTAAGAKPAGEPAAKTAPTEAAPSPATSQGSPADKSPPAADQPTGQGDKNPSAAAPAADSKAAAPPPTGKAADPTASNANKPSQEKAPAGRPIAPRWAALRAAWQEHDRLLQPSGDGHWTPIDYAPRAWRRYESAILDYEAHCREMPVTELKTAAGELSTQAVDLKDVEGGRGALENAAREFTDSRQPAENSGPVHDAFQLRNRATYRAIDLVTWHARASCALDQPLRELTELSAFLDDLAQLDDQLSRAVAAPAEGVSGASGSVVAGDSEALAATCKRLDDRLDAVERGLLASARAAIKEVLFDPNARGAARRIEDLLSVPLGDWSLRVELAEALERTGKGLEQVDAAKAAVATSAKETLATVALARERLNTSKQPWARGLEQAAVEARLVRLADTEEAKKLEDRIVPPASSSTASASAVRALGADLGDFYRRLPGRIKQADRQDMRRAEREIRLLPSGLFVAFPIDPVVMVHWAPPPVREFDFDGFDVTNPLLLAPSSGWKPLEGRLDARGEFTGDVRLSISYDKSKLAVESLEADRLPLEPGDSRVVSLGPAHASAAIRYRLRQVQLAPRRSVEFALTATASDRPELSKTWKVDCQAPPPDDVDLVVVPMALSDDPGDGSGRSANDRLVGGSIDGRPHAARAEARLSTFPGHVTSFQFRLKHQSERKRKVSVELLGVEDYNETTIASLRAVLARGSDEFLRGAARSDSPLKKLSSVKELVLPVEEPNGTSIEFPLFPPPPPPDAKEAKSPPPPSIAGGLVAVVSDLDNPDLGPWITWIDVEPWAPWHYVTPSVEYDGDKRLSVHFALSGAARPQDGRPIRVSWEESKDLPQERFEISDALLSKDNGYAARLDATVAHGPGKEVEIHLNVDGYPRAFVFKVPLDDKIRKGTIDWERNLAEIKIIEPKPGAAIRPPDDKLRIKLQVSAPDSSFDRGQGDRVEVGVDKTGDEGIDDKAISYTDRKQALVINRIGSGGQISIDTKVSDLEFDLAAPALNKRARVIARLVLQDRQTRPDSVEVIFDQTRPTIEIDPRERIVHRGESAVFQIAADDANLSGVRAVNWALDKRELDDAVRKEARQIKTPSAETGRYLLSFKPPDDLSIGSHPVLVWATDNVGLDSKPEVVTIDVREKREMAPAKKSPAATTGTIRGQVLYGKDPVAGATVSIVEGMAPTLVVKKSVQSDASGQFAIRDLPPGDYNLQAQGKARNKTRKSSITPVTVPTPPGTVSATIKLE